MPGFSFLQVSVETGDRLYAWGWRAAVAGALIMLIGLVLVLWGTRTRERGFEEQVAKLNVSAAQAAERAAELERDLDLLRRELAMRSQPRAPRVVSGEQATLLGQVLRGQPVHLRVIVVEGDAEAEEYADELTRALRAAGAHVSWSSIGARIDGRSVIPPGVSLSGARDSNFELVRRALENAAIEFDLAGPLPMVGGAETAIVIGTRRALAR
ncbi:MAG TPA: hypothetical protein VM489_05180 [Burkholderiales bacterium]|nr:hypothetical protein [Burkholderiales bacterium]